MSEVAISVAEAAKDFLKLVKEIETSRMPKILTRDGQPVAQIVPLPAPSSTCAELAQRLQTIQRLPDDEAELFARDIEHGRSTLPSVKSGWDLS